MKSSKDCQIKLEVHYRIYESEITKCRRFSRLKKQKAEFCRCLLSLFFSPILLRKDKSQPASLMCVCCRSQPAAHTYFELIKWRWIYDSPATPRIGRIVCSARADVFPSVRPPSPHLLAKAGRRWLCDVSSFDGGCSLIMYVLYIFYPLCGAADSLLD
jgi:hypothetical protein